MIRLPIQKVEILLRYKELRVINRVRRRSVAQAAPVTLNVGRNFADRKRTEDERSSLGHQANHDCIVTTCGAHLVGMVGTKVVPDFMRWNANPKRRRSLLS